MKALKGNGGEDVFWHITQGLVKTLILHVPVQLKRGDEKPEKRSI